jgi:hypothetical protein
MLPSFVVSPRLAVLLLSLLVVTVAADEPPERVAIADGVATEIA